MNATLNVNNLMEIRKIGLQALKDALGPVGDEIDIMLKKK